MENCLYLYFELVLRKNRIYYIYIEENKIHQVLNFKKYYDDLTMSRSKSMKNGWIKIFIHCALSDLTRTHNWWMEAWTLKIIFMFARNFFKYWQVSRGPLSEHLPNSYQLYMYMSPLTEFNFKNF